MTEFDVRGATLPMDEEDMIEKPGPLRWAPTAGSRKSAFEEDLTEQLLESSRFLISHSSGSVSRRADKALAGAGDIESARGLPGGMERSSSCAPPREGSTVPVGVSPRSVRRKPGRKGPSEANRPRLLKEKLRRDLLCGAFNELQDLVPGLKDQAPSKSQILNEAYIWI
ncbi:hypothetical protein BJX65DRAFT_312031 [Aspergillus insuetus]